MHHFNSQLFKTLENSPKQHKIRSKKPEKTEKPEIRNRRKNQKQKKKVVKLYLKKSGGIADIVANKTLSSDTNFIFIDRRFRFGFLHSCVFVHVNGD